MSVPPSSQSLPDADRVLQALREVGFRPIPARPGWLASVTQACATVRPVPGEPVPTWVVDDHRVRHRAGADVPVDATTLVCSCAGRTCGHVASLLVVLAFADPVRGAALRAPAWEVALGPMAPGLKTARKRHPGHLRYDLHPPAPGTRGLIVTPVIVRSDGRAPVRVPRTLEALEAELSELAAFDRILHPALYALERTRKLERSGRAEATRHLSRALIEPLSQVTDLRLEGRPIRVQTVPVRPRLLATRRPDGGLDLRWTPTVRLHWSDAGVALTEEDVLLLLPDDLPLATVERLLDPLPSIPAADVERFVDRLVVARGLPVELPADLPIVRTPDGCEARLTLEEVDGRTLEVRLDLVYLRSEGEVVVTAKGDPSTVLVPGEGLVRRDLAWEARCRSQFERDTGHADRLELVGEAALDFLLDTLPTLALRWPVFGRDGLTRLRASGSARADVRFSDHEDWFDLDVHFTVGGRSVGAAPVIASWRKGLRYHQLDDGTMARLPTTWLERHAGRVDTLVEARRAQSKLGSWHAWMVSDLLPAEGARWLRGVETLAAGIPERPPPAGLHATLRAYQRRGLDWLLFLRDHGLHGLLADEMGLGKTVQALAAIVDTPGPSLVVAPTSVVHNWCDEAARFTPGLRTLAWTGPRRDAARLREVDLVVTSYALLRRDPELTARPWSWVVLDEAQQIKNPASLGARAARRLVARHRLVLTGTPLENDLTELWSLFAFLMPGLLGRRNAFHARYARASSRASGPGLDELRERIRPFTLRRRKAEVAPELPPRTEVTLRIPLSEGERRLYDAVRNTVQTALTEAKGARISHVFLDGLTRLRQACCHPALLPFPEARRVQRSSKLEALLERIEEARAAGSRCLVFSQWVRLLDRVSDALRDRAIDHLRLQGDTVDRASVVARFQHALGPPVLLISIKAGGTGLNLTAADVVFHLDPWWNPAVEDQATDRAHRIGQLRPVTVVRLVAADTVEDRVLALQGRKRELFAQTIGQAPEEPLGLTLDDLRQLMDP